MWICYFCLFLFQSNANQRNLSLFWKLSGQLANLRHYFHILYLFSKIAMLNIHLFLTLTKTDLKTKRDPCIVSSTIGFPAPAYSPMSVALTNCLKVTPLSEFICLSILALTFSQLFPRAARFSRVDRRDDWRHYRAVPTAPQPKQSTHSSAHSRWDWQGRSTRTWDCEIPNQTPNNQRGMISIIMIRTLWWLFKVQW